MGVRGEILNGRGRGIVCTICISKKEQIQFFDSQIYYPVILKRFHNHGGIYKFDKIFKEYSAEINPLGGHRNIRGSILEANSNGLGW